jgi:hypothetical protein
MRESPDLDGGDLGPSDGDNGDHGNEITTEARGHGEADLEWSRRAARG